MMKNTSSKIIATILLLSLVVLLTFVSSTNAKSKSSLSTQLAAAFKLEKKQKETNKSRKTKRTSKRLPKTLKNKRLLKKKRFVCRKIRLVQSQITKLTLKISNASDREMIKIVRKIKVRKLLLRSLRRKLVSLKRKIKRRQRKAKRSIQKKTLEKLKKRVVRLARKQQQKITRPRIVILAFNRSQFFKKLMRNKKHRFFGKRGFRKYARLLSLLKLVRAKKAALTKKRNFYAKKEKKIVNVLRKLKKRWSVGKKKQSKTKITRIVLKNVDPKKKIKLVIPKRLKKKVKKIVVYSVKQ